MARIPRASMQEKMKQDLFSAVEAGDVEQVNRLIKAGEVNLEWKDKCEFTPLNAAAYYGHLELVELFVTLGAALNTQDDFLMTPLTNAVFKNHFKIVEYLLAKGADDSIKNKTGWSAMNGAAFFGCLESLKSLIAHGADIESRNKYGMTPLMMAALNGQVETMRYLLQEGADINAQTFERKTQVILCAIPSGNLDAVKLLFANGADLSARNENDETPIFSAAMLGKLEIVKYLLEHGVNKEVKNVNGDSAIDVAFENEHVEIVELLRNFNFNHFRLTKANFSGDIPDEFLDPISYEIMIEPITVSSGHTFDRHSLAAYFAARGNPATVACPMTRQPIKREELDFAVNVIIKNQIEKFITTIEQAAQIQSPPAADLANEKNSEMMRKRIAFFKTKSSASLDGQGSPSGRSGPSINR